VAHTVKQLAPRLPLQDTMTPPISRVPHQYRCSSLGAHAQVKIERPIMRIPMLAIHLYREIGEQGFKPNKQTHLAPILATAVKAAASKDAQEKTAGGAESKREAPEGSSEPQSDASNGSGDSPESSGKVSRHLTDWAYHTSSIIELHRLHLCRHRVAWHSWSACMKERCNFERSRT